MITEVSAKSGPQRSNSQPDAAVVEQEILAGLEHGEDLRMRQVAAPLVSLGRIEVETEMIAARQGDPAVDEPPDP